MKNLRVRQANALANETAVNYGVQTGQLATAWLVQVVVVLNVASE